MSVISRLVEDYTFGCDSLLCIHYNRKMTAYTQHRTSYIRSKDVTLYQLKLCMLLEEKHKERQYLYLTTCRSSHIHLHSALNLIRLFSNPHVK